MTGAGFLFLTLALVAAAADWVAVQLDRKPLEYVAKPLTMLLLIGAALALDPAVDAVRTWFVIALVLCAVGDVLLMVPQDLFVFGLASFLLGHLAYIVGMHVDGVEVPRFFVGIIVVMVILGVIGTIILRAVRAGPEAQLAGPVVAYMFVISAMVASAIGVGRVASVVGASLFYASDALIAWNRFLKPTRYGRMAIIVTYHLAQIGLVLSLA